MLNDGSMAAGALEGLLAELMQVETTKLHWTIRDFPMKTLGKP